MKRVYFAIICSSLFLFMSCKKEQQEVEKTVLLDAFNAIETHHYFDILLVEDTVSFVTIQGGENAVDKVDLLVQNKTLSIKDKRKLRFLKPGQKITLIIHSLPLKRIELFDGANLKTVNPISSPDFGLILSGRGNHCELELNTQTFYYWNNYLDGGKLFLSGSTEILKIWNYKLMSVDAKLLTAQRAIVENDSEGNCEVNVVDKLEYNITGGGDIYLGITPNQLIRTGVDEADGKLIIR